MRVAVALASAVAASFLIAAGPVGPAGSPLLLGEPSVAAAAHKKQKKRVRCCFKTTVLGDGNLIIDWGEVGEPPSGDGAGGTAAYRWGWETRDLLQYDKKHDRLNSAVRIARGHRRTVVPGKTKYTYRARSDRVFRDIDGNPDPDEPCRWESGTKGFRSHTETSSLSWQLISGGVLTDLPRALHIIVPSVGGPREPYPVCSSGYIGESGLTGWGTSEDWRSIYEFPAPPKGRLWRGKNFQRTQSFFAEDVDTADPDDRGRATGANSVMIKFKHFPPSKLKRQQKRLKGS